MRSIAYYWKEGLRNIFKHGFMSVAAVVIMVVSLLLTGTVTLVAYNITNNITRLQQSNQIVVWIDDSLTTREAKRCRRSSRRLTTLHRSPSRTAMSRWSSTARSWATTQTSSRITTRTTIRCATAMCSP